MTKQTSIITRREIRIGEIYDLLIAQELLVYPHLNKEQQSSLEKYVAEHPQYVWVYEIGNNVVGVAMCIPASMEYLKGLITSGSSLKLEEIPEMSRGQVLGVYILHLSKQIVIKGFSERVLIDIVENYGQVGCIGLTAVTEDSQAVFEKLGFKKIPLAQNENNLPCAGYRRWDSGKKRESVPVVRMIRNY